MCLWLISEKNNEHEEYGWFANQNDVLTDYLIMKARVVPWLLITMIDLLTQYLNLEGITCNDVWIDETY